MMFGRLGGALILGILVINGCHRPVPPKYQPQARVEKFDNADWQKVLQSAVTPDGYVRYDVLTENTDGVRDALYRYVGLVGAVSPENRSDLFATREDKLAFYLNAYNALAMYAVLKRGLPENTIKSGLPGSIYFVDTFTVGGSNLTLDKLEKKVREYQDVRVHFAMNCMTNFCPPLRQEAYTGGQLDQQLTDQGHRYLSDPRGAKKDGDNVDLGGIFKMYKNDFEADYRRKTGDSSGTVLDAAKGFAPDSSAVKDAKGMRLMNADWTLNRARSPATQPAGK